MRNIFYETYNKSMKNWLFFPQEYIQMIFILLTQWRIHRALCLLSYLLPLVCIITVFPRKRNGRLCLGSQIISCCRQRSWCRSKLRSLAFPFKCLISLFYLLSINFMWTGSGVPKWVMGSTGWVKHLCDGWEQITWGPEEDVSSLTGQDTHGSVLVRD